MKFIKYLLLACLLLSNAGYAAQKSGKNAGVKTRSISGQVFVVTKGGENIKLALVGVFAITESEFLQYLAASTSIKRGAQDKLILAENEEKESRAAKKAAEDRMSDLHDFYLKKDSTDRGAYKRFSDSSEYWEASKIREAAENAWSIKLMAEISARVEFRSFKTGAYYFSGLPAGISTSKTDVDGKFKLDLPAGKYALAAKSSRHVFGNTEEYYWIIWVNTSSQNQSVMLSNDNMFETQCSDCVTDVLLIEQSDKVIGRAKVNIEGGFSKGSYQNKIKSWFASSESEFQTNFPLWQFHQDAMEIAKDADNRKITIREADNLIEEKRLVFNQQMTATHQKLQINRNGYPRN